MEEGSRGVGTGEENVIVVGFEADRVSDELPERVRSGEEGEGLGRKMAAFAVHFSIRERIPPIAGKRPGGEVDSGGASRAAVADGFEEDGERKLARLGRMVRIWFENVQEGSGSPPGDLLRLEQDQDPDCRAQRSLQKRFLGGEASFDGHEISPHSSLESDAQDVE